MYQGLKLEDYLNFLKVTLADFRKNYEEQAKKNVISQLIISQIIKEEKIEATAEEVDAKLKNIMINIYHNMDKAAKKYGYEGNYVMGANIAGFEKVAEAMMAHGVV